MSNPKQVHMDGGIQYLRMGLIKELRDLQHGGWKKDEIIYVMREIADDWDRDQIPYLRDLREAIYG